MSRLPITPIQSLDAERASLHREIAGGRRAAFFHSIGVEDSDTGLPGPFNAMVRAPAVGRPLHRLGEALRYGGTLPALVREATILGVAVDKQSTFEWESHEDAARSAGADDTLLAALRSSQPLPDSACELAMQIVRPLLENRDVSDADLDSAVGAWGDEGVIELVVLVGYYTLLSDLMRAFRVE